MLLSLLNRLLNLRKPNMFLMSLRAVLFTSFVSFVLFPHPVNAVLANGFPEKLAIYYGWPSVVNGSGGDVTLASEVFNDYDIVIFGNTLDDPAHLDHANTQAIINNISDTTRSYGYVDLCAQGGASCSSLSVEEIQLKVDRWAAMGVAGIFLDQAGYDYGVSRDRLNSVVDYIHEKDLSAFVNIWNPDDGFSSAVHPTLNPAGAITHLNCDDYALDESFAVTLSQFQDTAFMITKADKELQYKRQFGTKIATVNTLAQAGSFDQTQFDYVWWMTLLYGFDAMAWGETWIFSSDSNSITFRERPNPNNGNIGRASRPFRVTHNGNVHTRTTRRGTIQIDSSTHTGVFTPF